MTSDVDRFSTACKVRLQTGKGSARNSNADLEMGKENVVNSGIKGCTEVNGNDNGRFARV